VSRMAAWLHAMPPFCVSIAMHCIGKCNELKGEPSCAHAGLVNLGDGIATTGVVLLLVRKLAAMDRALCCALLECGALMELQRLQVCVQACADGRVRVPCVAALCADKPSVLMHTACWGGPQRDCPKELVASVDAALEALECPRTGPGAPAARSSAAGTWVGLEVPLTPRSPGASSAAAAWTGRASWDAAGAPASPALDDLLADGGEGTAAPDPPPAVPVDLLDVRVLRAQARADWRLQESLVGE
jgi:hypothetical protein